MTGSKSVNKGCKYVFKVGEKKGQKCKKSCRGSYCNNHKPTKKEYRKTWITKKIEEVKNNNLLNKIEELKKLGLDKLPDPSDISIKIKKLASDRLYNFKKLVGVNLFLGKEQDEAISKLESIMFGKCTCHEMSTNDITKKMLKEAWQDSDISHYCETDDELKDNILSTFKCVTCDNYNREDCKFCNRPLRRVYFEYDGKNKTIAESKVIKLETKIDKLNEKINFQKKIKEVIEERLNEKVI